MLSTLPLNFADTPDLRSLRAIGPLLSVLGRSNALAEDDYTAKHHGAARKYERPVRKSRSKHVATDAAALGRPGLPASNRLWGTLSDAALERLLPASEMVTLRPGSRLMHAEQACSHVYFPCTATVSLILTTKAGQSCQVGMVGNEGMVGVQMVAGALAVPYDAVVRTEGVARRLSVSAVAAECGPASAEGRLLMRYSQTLMAQMAYAAVCCQHHSVEQRTCRLLLQSFDAVGDELRMTQETMAECLGVRRESVTTVAARLCRDNVITYARGHIFMANRSALEARSCECYAAVKHELESIFGQVTRYPAHLHQSVSAVSSSPRLKLASS